MAIKPNYPTTADKNLEDVFKLLARVESDKEPTSFTKPLKVIPCPSVHDGAVLIVTGTKLYLHMSGGYASIRGVIGDFYCTYAKTAVETMRAGGLISEGQAAAFYAWWATCLNERTSKGEQEDLRRLAAKYHFDLVAK